MSNSFNYCDYFRAWSRTYKAIAPPLSHFFRSKWRHLLKKTNLNVESANEFMLFYKKVTANNSCMDRQWVVRFNQSDYKIMIVHSFKCFTFIIGKSLDHHYFFYSYGIVKSFIKPLSTKKHGDEQNYEKT
jgi:hypothetical protein